MAGGRTGARTLPRKFEFQWGRGLVTEEASGVTPYHEPTVQLLGHETCDRAIRFCGYEHGRLGRYPLEIPMENLAALGKEVKKNKPHRWLLTRLVG